MYSVAGQYSSYLYCCGRQAASPRLGRTGMTIVSEVELEVSQMQTSHFFDIGEDCRGKQQKNEVKHRNNGVMMLKYIPKKLKNRG